MRLSRVCKTSQSESLSAYVDGMLDGQALRRLSRHLESCEDCRNAADKLARTISILSSVRNAPCGPSESFWADAYRSARLSADEPVKSAATRGRIFAAPPKWRLASLAAIGAVTIALTFMPTGTMRGILSEPADAAPSIDVSALVNAHASSTSDEPLADHQRLSMIVADITAQQAGGYAIDDGSEAADGAPDAGPGSN